MVEEKSRAAKKALEEGKKLIDRMEYLSTNCSKGELRTLIKGLEDAEKKKSDNEWLIKMLRELAEYIYTLRFSEKKDLANIKKGS